jgi:hypothetical protein
MEYNALWICQLKNSRSLELTKTMQNHLNEKNLLRRNSTTWNQLSDFSVLLLKTKLYGGMCLFISPANQNCQLSIKLNNN